MEANKLVIVFLMSMVVLSAVRVSTADFENCYKNCHKDCAASGHGYTVCALKCETDCSFKQLKEEFEEIMP
ncbi:hypothetical protein BC332_23637 [Capsicum chinense]|nr:hypothetical protein BC332_23637 [Capsicum chinense]